MFHGEIGCLIAGKFIGSRRGGSTTFSRTSFALCVASTTTLHLRKRSNKFDNHDVLISACPIDFLLCASIHHRGQQQHNNNNNNPVRQWARNHDIDVDNTVHETIFWIIIASVVICFCTCCYRCLCWEQRPSYQVIQTHHHVYHNNAAPSTTMSTDIGSISQEASAPLAEVVEQPKQNDYGSIPVAVPSDIEPVAPPPSQNPSFRA
ncbi:expressed unknown protein [Seminavis robusta]|uniref:Uncharacterized protein n=1 Tax=Seminavis robusta TaxID=568900 RepID=A0A9N8EH03_9STRA|nr:expressed unknown protein [Seminavis robusta]|eukprot:Sro981_g227560.1 n/a (206) ;mRNA; r:27664-28361